MQFTQQPTQDGVIITLQGDFTFKDHHSFRAVMDLLSASTGSNQVLDLGHVSFLDSAALGMLLIAEDEARKRDRTLTLRNPSAQIARLFELSAMDSIFRIEH